MTQSIIVYRNPVEAAFWESGLVIPIFAGCAVGFLTFIALYKIAEKFCPRRYGFYNVPNYVTAAAGVFSTIIGFLVMNKLAI